MSFTPGERVLVPMVQAPASREGTVVAMRHDDHLPWPMVTVRHDIGAPHPTGDGVQDCWDHPVWMVRR